MKTQQQMDIDSDVTELQCHAGTVCLKTACYVKKINAAQISYGHVSYCLEPNPILIDVYIEKIISTLEGVSVLFLLRKHTTLVV